MKLPEPAEAPPLLCHSTTLVGQPAGLLAGVEFNDYPVPLHISGTREANHSLFQILAQAEDLDAAASVFQDYLDVVFGFDPEQRQGVGADGRRRFRSSYLRLLKGWGFDSNGPEGAVLKGWVESRFGLFPNFHKTRVAPSLSPEWIAYVEEKMCSRFHNNCINMQLDLLYEFCQWSLECRHAADVRHATLYRGTNDFAEHPMLIKLGRREAVVRLNNLVSFTSDRDIACEFGDYILEARIPLAKILFFNDLLPSHALRGEAEFLVIGGDYRVKVSTL